MPTLANNNNNNSNYNLQPLIKAESRTSDLVVVAIFCWLAVMDGA